MRRDEKQKKQKEKGSEKRKRSGEEKKREKKCNLFLSPSEKFGKSVLK